MSKWKFEPIPKFPNLKLDSDKCGICGKEFDNITSGNNPWLCLNCSFAICEDCGDKKMIYGENGHCIGIDCPSCKKRGHFEEL